MGHHFRNAVRAALLCTGLLVCGFVVLFHTSAAKADPLAGLLRLPAPPPPNPLVPSQSGNHDEAFYDPAKPPPDNAPIQDLIDYWTRLGVNAIAGQPARAVPSEKTIERLIKEANSNPDLALSVVAVLPNDKKTVGMVKDVYDRLISKETSEDANTESSEASGAYQLKEWLKFNSPYFSDELEKAALGTKDNSSQYVDTGSENAVLALTRYDWDRANPIITRMYGDRSQPVTQVLETWALYRHALDTDSPSDIDRYRSELMHMVEDRSLPAGVRDKANDAITHEKDFPGREEWTISLFEDETLVNLQPYTGLTTLMMYAPSEKYVDRLISLLEKNNKPIVRAGAVRSLFLALKPEGASEQDVRIVKAMLPWLEDPKWADDPRDERATLVRKLGQMQMPESVPGLIKVLEEKRTVMVPDYGSNTAAYSANSSRAVTTANAARGVANAVVAADNALANVSNTSANSLPNVPSRPTETFPYRSDAMQALTKQRDGRAIPALRRTLNTVEEYERATAVRAIYMCGGFSIQEQLDAVDLTARAVLQRQDMEDAGLNTNTYANSYYSASAYSNRLSGTQNGPPSAVEVRTLLGQQLMDNGGEVTDDLARSVAQRVSDLDKRDPQLAQAYRTVVMQWANGPVDILFLNDLKHGVATTEALVRLLATRKDLKQRLPGDVAALRTGVPRSVGFAACMLEDKAEFDPIIENAEPDAKIALLACGRLLRLEMDVTKVAKLLNAKEPLLVEAAEAYLKAEDSPAARTAVLQKHPGEALVLGARANFEGGEGADSIAGPWLAALFQNAGSDSLYYGWGSASNDPDLDKSETALRAEVKKDDNLYGVYAFDKNYVRIYRDHVTFSWDDDESRYYERPMAPEEFEEIKSYLTAKRADEQPPYLYCGGAYCEARELLMLGRNGGRRVYVAGNRYGGGREESDFFDGLDKYFKRLRLAPATLKYSMSRDVPGLAIDLADRDLTAKTVWKNGDDLRVAVCSKEVRDRVQEEIDAMAPEGGDPNSEEPAEAVAAKRAKLIEQRRYEGCSWQHVSNGSATGITTQPTEVEYFPIRDGMPVQPSDDQWKARAGGVELRAGAEGLFLIARGQATRLAEGSFSSPLMTASGRWGVAMETGGEDGQHLVRIDITRRKVLQVKTDESGYFMQPVAYIRSIDRVLLAQNYGSYEEAYGEGYSSDEVQPDPDPSGLLLLDPATGQIQEPRGELRPLAQQTFRALQQSANGGAHWAAMPDHEKRSTTVGLYDERMLTFKPVATVPKILFNSMDMWVDEAGQRIYFVYRGHLLSLPIKLASPAPAGPPRRSRQH
jgi:hypothetical protein